MQLVEASYCSPFDLLILADFVLRGQRLVPCGSLHSLHPARHEFLAREDLRHRLTRRLARAGLYEIVSKYLISKRKVWIGSFLRVIYMDTLP